MTKPKMIRCGGSGQEVDGPDEFGSRPKSKGCEFPLAASRSTFPLLAENARYVSPSVCITSNTLICQDSGRVSTLLHPVFHTQKKIENRILF